MGFSFKSAAKSTMVCWRASLNIIGGSGLIYSFYVLNNPIDAKQVSDFIVNLKASDAILERIAQAKRYYQDRIYSFDYLV
jgi:hypothetical protein